MQKSDTDNPKTTYAELGTTGLPVYAGRVYDEPLDSLRGDAWKRAVREMTTNDAVIGAILFVIEMLARQVTWDFEPADESNEAQKEAEFFREVYFKDQAQTWQETLAEILSFLPWGWAYFEECYKRRSGESRDKTKNSRYSDGRVGLRKLAIRAQESLHSWEFDDYDEVAAMVQQPAPTFDIFRIPIEKSLLFRTSAHKGNPEGRSIIRTAYRPFYFKSNIENIEGIGIERDLAGLPTAGMPPEYLAENAPADKQALRNAVLKMLRGIRRDENEGVLYPLAYDDKGNKLFELSLLSSGGRRQFDTSAIISRWDQRIAMTVIADFLLLGSQRVGSYALSHDKTDMFEIAMGAWLDTICDTFNRNSVPRLGKLNAVPEALLPKMTHGSVEKISLKDLGEYISKLSGAQIVFDEEEAAFLKRKIVPPSKNAKAAKSKPAAKKQPAEKQSDDKKSDDQKPARRKSKPKTDDDGGSGGKDSDE